METVQAVSNWLTGLGATVMLPIVVFLLGIPWPEGRESHHIRFDYLTGSVIDLNGGMISG